MHSTYHEAEGHSVEDLRGRADLLGGDSHNTTRHRAWLFRSVNGEDANVKSKSERHRGPVHDLPTSFEDRAENEKCRKISKILKIFRVS